MKYLLILGFLLALTPNVWAESAKITGDKMELDKANNQMILIGNVFAIRNKTKATLRADQLELTRDLETEKLTYGKAEGNIILNEYLDIVLSDYLNFDDSEKIAILQGNIFITTGELFFEGHKLRYQYEAEKGHLFGLGNKLTVSIFHKEKPDKNGMRLPIKAWATEIIINRPLGKITLQGKVKVLDHFDGSVMTAERMDIYLNDDEAIKEIIADGKFTLEQPGRSARSNRAFLDYQSEIITLTGKAYLKEVGSAAVQSGRIEMHMDSEKGTMTSEDKKPVTVDVEF